MISTKKLTDLVKQLSQSTESVKVISRAFTRLTNENINFQDWKSRFHFIHGHLETQKSVEIEKLCLRYKVEINSQEDMFRLIFILESFYTTILCLFLNRILSLGHEKDLIKRLGDNFPKQVKSAVIQNKDLFSEESELIDYLYFELVQDIDFDSEKDIVRELFEDLIDKRIRHSLGEYFTPDWLSQLVIKRTVGDQDVKSKTFLDPTCGSGTFLRNTIRLYRDITNGEIFNCVYGIDINPVSVFAAQINYLIEYYSYFQSFDNLPERLPIFEADVTQEVIYSVGLFDDKPKVVTDSIGKVDFIVGNPPWVNWEYLPKSYRERTHEAWKYYGLYSGKGLDSNFLKEDISCLITYVVTHKYLKKDGKLGFLLKESLFKSVKQGKYFRKFFLQPENLYLGIDCILDLTYLSPFEGINPRTVALIFTKGLKTDYPFNYLVIKPTNGKRRFPIDWTINDIENAIEEEEILATPSNPNDISSSIMTLNAKAMKVAKSIVGKSYYKARTGVFTGGGNAMYWLSIEDKDGEKIKVHNIIGRAKNKVEEVNCHLESDFVFPFVTGSDVGFWSFKYDKYIVCPHTATSKMNPINHTQLSQYPLMQSYFERFKADLELRKGFTGLDKGIHEQFYYSLQRIGEYTFAPYKVAWKYISKNFVPVVIENVHDKFLGVKTCLPNEKVIYVGLESADEAYYLCGFLSSTFIRQTIESYMVGTQITPSIISNIGIDKFNKNNSIHYEISDLCQKGHKGIIDIQKAVKLIDDQVLQLINLNK